ncbi:hypothetical protein PVAP13_3KG264992 [Panicum virgatum]|uniref:Uncharacterized protein n=1 Tax=Panicum virgatum TaxID=38727 RepID=A0A8T0V311_PANVG|nr:hypothetical protein PVAP13_3KG264992 [Panicum virgatum]
MLGWLCLRSPSALKRWSLTGSGDARMALPPLAVGPEAPAAGAQARRQPHRHDREPCRPRELWQPHRYRHEPCRLRRSGAQSTAAVPGVGARGRPAAPASGVSRRRHPGPERGLDHAGPAPAAALAAGAGARPPAPAAAALAGRKGAGARPMAAAASTTAAQGHGRAGPSHRRRLPSRVGAWARSPCPSPPPPWTSHRQLVLPLWRLRQRPPPLRSFLKKR